MKASVTLRSPTPTSFRAAAVQGLFDVPRRDEQEVLVEADLPIENQEWSVGAIVGASGTGKTTIARELWGAGQEAEWGHGCILDYFPAELTPSDVASLLTSVGLSSTPVWLRPYQALSTGQRFRAELARALAQTPVKRETPANDERTGSDTGDVKKDPVVFDEFTSVVDRTVAKAASVSVAKHVRRSGQQFVAVTCHRDVLPWLECDWVYDTDRGFFQWTRGHLQRPEVALVLREGSREAWPLFREHHYLTRTIATSARVLLAYVTLDGEERLAGFFSLMPRMMHRGSTKSWLRGHRTVVLPDYQGLGIGNRMVELGAEALWRQEGVRYAATTAAPALIAHRRRHPEMWRLVDPPKMRGPSVSRTRKITTSAGRLTCTWEYLPEGLR